jgi:hypothetical protein
VDMRSFNRLDTHSSSDWRGTPGIFLHLLDEVKDGERSQQAHYLTICSVSLLDSDRVPFPQLMDP